MRNKLGRVVVYTGEGVGKQSLADAKSSIQLASPTSKIVEICAEEVKKSDWHTITDLFVMPGGRDLPYCEALNGPGTDSIKKYVSQGGRYLGFCAGAYFACSAIEFERGTKNEVIGTRELALFPGTAVGSALGIGTYSYFQNESACMTRISTFDDGALDVYFDGGCYFLINGHHCEVLARYENVQETPPAIVCCNYGKGRVILSGVHPEFRAETSRSSRPDIAQKLENNEESLSSFLSAILAKF